MLTRPSAIIAPPSQRVATIGVLGCGVVGGGVVDRLLREPTLAGFPVRLAAVLVRDIAKARTPETVRPHLTTDICDVVDDPDTDIVVECLGGADVAADHVTRALRNGKHVVTSNKTLVADRGPALLALAGANRVWFRCEAAVGGAIPVVGTLRTALGAEHLREVGGVLNGTTNFILSAMESGLDFPAALAYAQALGLAEADPTADVDGHDAAQKLAILMAAAFDVWVSWRDIPRRGVRDVRAEHITRARKLGARLKLVAHATRSAGGISAVVTPAYVPLVHEFSRPQGAENVVRVVGEECGSLTFAGTGAGRNATASAVLGDLAQFVRAMASGNAVVQAFRAAGDAALLLPPSYPLDGEYPVWAD